MGSIGAALRHFDKFYPYIYSTALWRSIRLGLLCKSKKMFLINTAYNDTNGLINLLKMNGALSFLDNLVISESTYVFTDNENDFLHSDEKLIGTQMNEFVKSTKYIGENEIKSKTITDTFTNYSHISEDEDLAKNLNDGLREVKLSQLNYETVELPTYLKVMAYPRGIVKKEYRVPYDEFNQSGFYPIDGFSILVVLLMNIQKGDKLLDMCAAPGGKSVAMLQTGLPSELVCIDKEKSRVLRLQNVLKSHVSPEDLKKVNIIQGDSINETRFMDSYFDKVLLDAPCSSDRYAVTDKNFSLFSPQMNKKRMNILETQHELLRMAVKCCKMGGDIIYSTCTLSPVQNDNVIATIIKDINSQATDFQLRTVKCNSTYLNSNKKYQSKSPDTQSSDWFTTFDNGCGLGQIIVPNILNNYGPGYVCKIRKLPLTSPLLSVEQ